MQNMQSQMESLADPVQGQRLFGVLAAHKLAV